MIRLPPLEALRVFEAAARHANFSTAARELHLTPAAVSLRVRGLEESMGVILFHRSGPRLTLSGAGVALARRLSPALTEIGQAVAEARGRRPSVRIACTPSMAGRWLAPRLPFLDAGAARIELLVSADLEPVGAFDIAIRSGSGDWPGLRSAASRPIGATPMLAPVLTGRRLVRPSDLLALPLIADPLWPTWFAKAGAPMQAPRFLDVDYPSQALAAEAALQGAGAALLAPDLFAPLVEAGRLVQPFQEVVWGPAAHHLLVGLEERRPEVLGLLDQLVSAFADAGAPSAGPVSSRSSRT